ncbi:MAG TPA: secretin N-terminal domain-containing protein [Vicinamibacterales bacterium]|nr:secretin N-terminal domain-containing protein [Vicinamibacterales bacterium]
MPNSFLAHSSRLSLALLTAALLVSCASGGSLRSARNAELSQNYDIAVAEYTKLLRKNPDSREARQGLERAKLRASQDHFTKGRRLIALGNAEEALVEFQLASELNPGNAEIERELQETRSQLRTRIAIADNGKTRLESLIAQSMAAPMPGQDLPADAALPDSVVFRDANARDIYSAIGKFTNLSVIFDPTFRDQVVSIDLRGQTLEEALNGLSKSTRNFWRVTSPRTITVVPDTAAKRREYEEEIVRTFYLSNADLKETIDMLRIVVDARRISSITATNAITIKDTPERIAAAQKIIAATDKARPEVIIDVELLEVNRTHLHEYGLQIASAGQPGVSGSADINKEGLSLRSLASLTSADVMLTALPSLYYRLLKSDVATRILANPQLRTAEGIPAQARFGERVPVPVTTFAPIAAGGVQTQPITSFNYEPIGVNIDITPRMHHDDAVSLAIKIELSSISGKGFGDLPTFGSRQISTVIRLKDGETNMLAGLIRDEERTSLSGWPGLSDIPVIGRLFAHNKKETQETDIILTLTPRIVRVLNLTMEDLQPFRVGRDGGAPLTDLAPPLPLPIPLPTPPAKPPGGDAVPGTAPTFPGSPAEPAKPIVPLPIKPPKGG